MKSKTAIIGMGLALGIPIEALVPRVREQPVRVVTEFDKQRIAAAEAKRQRKAERNKRNGRQTLPD